MGVPTSPPRAASPEFRADRCTHARVVEASCRRCIDICPAGAWTLGAQALELDADRCDGCGQCAAVCPTRAIGPRWRMLRHFPRALAACGQVTAAGEPGAVPCLHGIGEDELFDLADAGFRTLVVSHGDCAACSRRSAQTLEDRLGSVRAVLASRELTCPSLERVPPAEWPRMAPRVAAAKPASPARRGFLGRVLTGRAHAEGPDDAAQSESDQPATARLAFSAHAIHAWRPRIDEQVCTACDACVRICPTGALTDAQSCYAVAADRCTGCAMCSDVCDSAAVRVERLAAGESGRVALVGGRCRACGADFRRTAASGVAGDECPVCAKTARQRALFQVIRE